MLIQHGAEQLHQHFSSNEQYKEAILLTTKPHLEADPEAGLHDLTHSFVREVLTDVCQQQHPQHLQTIEVRFRANPFTEICQKL